MNVDDIGWYFYNSGQKTHIVGGKQPNAFGLYDMSGNVFEWCGDRYHPNYDGAPNDGSTWLSGGHVLKAVARGGGFHMDKVTLRSAYRAGWERDSPNNLNGFRVVAVVRTN